MLKPLLPQVCWRTGPDNLFVLTDGDLESVIRTKELDFNLPAFARVSAQGKQCLKAMLQRDYTQRPTAEELLKYKWFNPRSETRPPAILVYALLTSRVYLSTARSYKPTDEHQ